MSDGLIIPTGVAGSFASTGNAGLIPSGAFNVRVTFRLSDFTSGDGNRYVAGVWDSDAGERAWALRINSVGTFQFVISTSGTSIHTTFSSPEDPPYVDGQFIHLAALFNPSVNGTHRRVTFFHNSPAESLGNDTRSGTVGDLHASSAKLTSGAMANGGGLLSPGGAVRRVLVAPDGSTDWLADADFTDAHREFDYTDNTDRTWVLNGDAHWDDPGQELSAETTLTLVLAAPGVETWPGPGDGGATALPSVAGHEHAHSFSDAVTVDRPAGTADGELLTSVISTRNNRDMSLPPAGWALVASGTSGVQRTFVYTRVAEGEPESWTWQLSGTEHQVGMVLRVTGADPDAPLMLDPALPGESATTSLTLPSLDAEELGGLLLALLSARDDNSTAGLDLTGPDGMTFVDRVDQPESFPVIVAAWAQEDVDTGATGPKVVSYPELLDWRVGVLLVRPAEAESGELLFASTELTLRFSVSAEESDQPVAATGLALHLGAQATVTEQIHYPRTAALLGLGVGTGLHTLKHESATTELALNLQLGVATERRGPARAAATVTTRIPNPQVVTDLPPLHVTTTVPSVDIITVVPTLDVVTHLEAP